MLTAGETRIGNSFRLRGECDCSPLVVLGPATMPSFTSISNISHLVHPPGHHDHTRLASALGGGWVLTAGETRIGNSFRLEGECDRSPLVVLGPFTMPWNGESGKTGRDQASMRWICWAEKGLPLRERMSSAVRAAAILRRDRPSPLFLRAMAITRCSSTLGTRVRLSEASW